MTKNMTQIERMMKRASDYKTQANDAFAAAGRLPECEEKRSLLEAYGFFAGKVAGLEEATQIAMDIDLDGVGRLC